MVCGVLFVDGPCAYVVRDDGVTADFITNNVTQSKWVSPWAVHCCGAFSIFNFQSQDNGMHVPNFLRERAMAAYNQLPDRPFPAAQNPVVKRPLAITGHGACLLYTSPSPRDGATSRMPSSA